MSFGFGDIAKAIEICAWIWAHCFRDSRAAGERHPLLTPPRPAAYGLVSAADHRYRQFGREIQQLQPALQGLWAVVQEARGEVDPFERESKDIAGDFVRTLEACRDLLDRHVELKKNRAGVIENVIWNLHVQEQVDELCDQLRFHTQTLQLVAASHGTQLLLEIRREVAWLVEAQVWPGAARQEAQAPALELVPAWLDSVFGANAALAPPVPFEGLDNIPVRQGCEALRQHFGRLSREDGARESRAEFILEYLSLLKCHWIIRVLREAKDLDLRHPAYPLRRFISNVDLEVLQRIRSRTRCGVVPVTDDELRAAHGQSNEPFLIWEPPKERPQRRPWMKEHGEEKLRAVPLTGGEKLLFFKKSPTTMRIVPVVETDGEPRLSQYHGEMNLNVRTDSFVPLYAVDDQRDAPAVEIYRKDEERPVKFQLDDIKAAWGIQGVITGYQVRDDDDRVTWSMLRPAFNGLSLSLTARTVEMTGRIQVWQWKPQSEDSAAHVEARSMSASSGSGVSMESLGSEPASLLSRLSTGRTVPSIPESQSSRLFTDTELPQGSHRQLQPPVPPALVFFARSGRTYTYFHLESKPCQQNVRVVARRCPPLADDARNSATRALRRPNLMPLFRGRRQLYPYGHCPSLKAADSPARVGRRRVAGALEPGALRGARTPRRLSRQEDRRADGLRAPDAGVPDAPEPAGLRRKAGHLYEALRPGPGRLPQARPEGPAPCRPAQEDHHLRGRRVRPLSEIPSVDGSRQPLVGVRDAERRPGPPDSNDVAGAANPMAI